MSDRTFFSIRDGFLALTDRDQQQLKPTETSDLVHVALQLHLDGATLDNRPLLRWVLSHSRLSSLWAFAPRPDWILSVVDWADRIGAISNLDEKGLRIFACWCARGCRSEQTVNPSETIVDLAERFANGTATAEELLGARVRNSGGAQGAGVCGLPRRIPTAAWQLARFHTLNESALAAAQWASWFSLKAREFELDAVHCPPARCSVHPFSLRHLTPALNGPAAQEEHDAPALISLRAEHVSRLRELVRHPFVNVDVVRIRILANKIERSLASLGS